jgi:hypothetical protein
VPEIGAQGFLNRHRLEPQQRALIGATEHVASEARSQFRIKRGKQGEIVADRTSVGFGQAGSCRRLRPGSEPADELVNDVSHCIPLREPLCDALLRVREVPGIINARNRL